MKYMRRTLNSVSLLLLLLFFTVLQSLAQQKTVSYLFDTGAVPSEKFIDVTHLTAIISIDPYRKIVEGKATFNFKTLRETTDSVQFDITDIRVSEITIDNRPVNYQANGNSLIIYPGLQIQKGKDYTLNIIYKAISSSYLYLSGWDDTSGIKRKQIWAHRPFSWLPYTDARLTVDMFVTFNKDYKVFSNGERVEVIPQGDSLLTWHYRMNHPHPFFSTALVIGDYDYRSFKAASGLPLEMWYYPEQEDRVETTYLYMSEMISFFEKDMGLSYPWELYRQVPVVDYLYGAMETTTSTVFGDYMFVNQRAFSGRNYVNVNAHELAHQWFGNYISHLAPKDVWLTESFATYYAKIFERSVFGEDYYQNERNNEFIETFEASVKDNYATGHSYGGRARWYPKGSLILDMLRDIMGDENFKTAIRYYLENHPYTDAQTSDFLKSIYLSTGMNMDWFFDEWIKRPGEPYFKVRYERIAGSDKADVTQVTVSQVHEINEVTGYFRMPVWFEIHYSDGSFAREKVWVDGQQTIANIENTSSKEIGFVLFDPGRRILKKVTFEKSFDELSLQALKAPMLIDRYDALVAMENLPLDQKKDFLLNCYGKEKFFLTKAEIIKQFTGDMSTELIELVRKAVNDSDVYVRRAALQHVKNVPPALKNEFEKLLNDESYINVGIALQNLSASFPDETATYLDATKDENGWRGKNIRISWLEIAVENGHKEYIQELIGYSSKSFEFETRQNALNALKRLNLMDTAIANNLIDAYLYWNYKLSNTAKEVLAFFMQENYSRKILTDFWQGNSWTEKQQKQLSAIFK